MTGAAPEPTGKPARATDPAGEALEGLVTFIAKAFDQRDELKRFVRQLPEGVELATTLPGDIASTANIAYALIASVTSRGLLDADFFALLLKMRPKLGAQINELRQRCLCVDEPAGTPAPGVILRGGRYKLEEMIDHGAVASVWRAVDRHNDTQVAIKVLRRDMRDYKLRRWQFIKGAKHFAAISSPRIARIIEPHFMEMGLDFCVLQFVRGRPLAEAVKSRRLATPLAVVDVILDIGTGLEALHPRIFHGDISPKNIIIGDDGRATLVDFDLASDIDELPMTQATGLPGTDPYASPEWRNRRDAIDARTDIFSLGMTAVYALYGGKNLPLGLNDSLVGEPGPFIDKYLTCDATIKAVLKRACAFDLTERYPTVQQFCHELRRAMAPPPQAEAPAAPPRPTATPRPALQSRPVAEQLGPIFPPPPTLSTTSPATQPATRVQREPSEPQAPIVTIPRGAPSAAKQSSPTQTPLRQPIIAASKRPQPVIAAPRGWRVATGVGVGVAVAVLAAGFAVWDLFPAANPTSADLTLAPAPALTPTGAGLTNEESTSARAAIRSLGLNASDSARAALQQIASDPNRSPRAVAQARLLAAELLLTRALSCQIAARIEPTARDGQLGIRAGEDVRSADELLAHIGEAADQPQLRRMQVLQALVHSKPPGALPPASDELAALVKAAPLWRGEVNRPPPGLISALQRIPDPSSLTQSVLALALWRGGDRDGARVQLRNIIDIVGDHPLASVLLTSLGPEEPALELPPAAPIEPPPEPEVVAAPTKKTTRKTPRTSDSTPVPVSEEAAALAYGTIEAIIRERAPAMIKRCKVEHYGEMTEHAIGNSVTLTISIKSDGKGVKAVPDDSSEGVAEATCLKQAIEHIDFGPLPAARQTFDMKFAL